MARRIPEDYIGSRLHHFVIQSIETRLIFNRNVKVYTCRCDCGKLFDYQASKVFSNQIQSCGCQHTGKTVRTRSIRDRLYIVWVGMKIRCTDPTHQSYYRYGGRGISYDPTWEVFDVFRLVNRITICLTG